MRLLLLGFLVCAPQIWACCPTDKDDFADEVEDESVLDVVTGKIERPIPEYWEAKFDAVQNSDLPALDKDIALAKIEDQLNRQDNALERIVKLLDDPTLDAETKLRLYRLRAEFAMNLWWMDGKRPYTPEVCLMIALDGAGMQPDAKYLKLITAWARDAKLEPDSLYVPDFFGLRYATNKSADHDTGELRKRGLEDAEQYLLDRMRKHSAWENFDVIYTLSMLYVVQGKQNLAYFTRLRAWELHESGVRSRVEGGENVTDIKPLTILRQLTTGELKPVKVVDDENQKMINEQFSARRAYTKAWKQARAAYAAEQLRNNVSALGVDFWSGFTPPKSEIPALLADAATVAEIPPEADQDAEETSHSRTWITLAVLFVLLVLGGVTKARISRSAVQLSVQSSSAEVES